MGSTAAFMSSLAYVPLNMRYRGISVFTNTPPRSAQRAPGGVQAVTMIEPLMERAAKALGIDRVEIRKVNAANHDSKVGPAQSPITSAFVREAIDVGADTFGWEELKQLSGRRQGSKVTGVGIGLSPFVGGSTGYDGLMVILPDGRLRVHQGIGNLGTHSNMDTARAAADVLGMPWDRCEVGWGDTSKHLPWSCSQAGSQTEPCSIEIPLSPGNRSNTPSKIIAERNNSALFLIATMPSAPDGASDEGPVEASPLF